MTASLRERVLSRLMIDTQTGCLLWTGALGKGYGLTSIGGRMLSVHRLMYEWFVGPIPEGLQIDHLCRVKRCASPAHLEAVTCRVNLLRGNTITAANAAKTHCPYGHPYDECNTYIRRDDGTRQCRLCNQIRSRNQYRASVGLPLVNVLRRAVS